MNTLKKLLKNLRVDEAVEIKPGKMYAIEVDRLMPPSQANQARTQWRQVTGADVVFIYGGHIVRSEEFVERVAHPSQDQA